MKRFIPLILIEGATVMAVELCGAKLMAPLYGGGLFVWAAILAITLSALAGGYFYGGILSQKENTDRVLFNIISVASICIAIMPFIATYLLPYISYINFKVAVILSAVLLIFIPIFLLGCTTPLFVRLNTAKAEMAGVISGRVYAISTFGGIVSTLLCGFVLIPAIGLKFTLLCFAIILFVTAAIILKLIKGNASIVLLVVFVFALQNYSRSEAALYANHGILGEIEVVDLSNENESVRRLLINKIVQTELNLNTQHSTSAYIRFIDSLIVTPKKKSNALVLGLGGGLLANKLCSLNYSVDGVEFDERIIEAAKMYFQLDPSVQTFPVDARSFINRCEKKYELIVFDLFKAEDQPSHVLTMESIKKVKNMLSPNASMIINWHGFVKQPLGKGTEILLNTLTESGFSYQLIATGADEDHSNTLIIAKLQQGLNATGSLLVNTDDQPVLEAANARANLRWRINYLRYYQGKK
jgi:predicted membrane-bound spermidine synthase